MKKEWSLFDLPIPELIFQSEEVTNDVHILRYTYKQKVNIDADISIVGDSIYVNICSSKDGEHLEEIVSRVETFVIEALKKHPTYRLYVVTGAKDFFSMTYCDEGPWWKILLNERDHYHAYGQWVILLAVFLLYGWDLSLGKWAALSLTGIQVLGILWSGRIYMRSSGDMRSTMIAKYRIQTTGTALMLNGLGQIFVSVFT